jgi:ankyrin repeat protein
MSINQLQTELLKVLGLGKSNQHSIIKRLDRLYEDFGGLNMQKWRYASNKSNSLLHELVDKEMPDVIRHLVEVRKFDINVRRGSDGLTPLQLAIKNDNSEVSAVLVDLGAVDIQTEDVSTWLSDEDKTKAMNIVWMDLEMTSLEDPEIMECAIIITDKDLHKLDEGKLYFAKFLGKFILF